MPLDINRVKALCFDIDGTLSDTDDQFVLKLARRLEPLHYLFRGYDPLLSARRMVMFTEGPGNWAYSLADRIGLDVAIVRLSDWFYQLGIGKSAKPYRLITGVREMLEVMSNLYPLSIISARGQKSTSRFLSQFELQPFFKAIASGQTCKHTKPYPDPIIWAAENMGVESTSCLMIGDTAVDIKTGKMAGAQTVGVLCGFGEREELIRAGADLILESTPDLLGVLLEK